MDDSSLYVIILRYLKAHAEVDRWMKPHVQFVQRHIGEGRFLVAGRQIPRCGGIILARAESAEELDRIIEEDPFYEQEIAEFMVIRFRASLAHPRFRQLLEELG